jgi:hypothetical protein
MAPVLPDAQIDDVDSQTRLWRLCFKSAAPQRWFPIAQPFLTLDIQTAVPSPPYPLKLSNPHRRYFKPLPLSLSFGDKQDWNHQSARIISIFQTRRLVLTYYLGPQSLV